MRSSARVAACAALAALADAFSAGVSPPTFGATLTRPVIDDFKAALVAPRSPPAAKWRNVRNVPGVLRHILNPDSPDFRPELKDGWDKMGKKQRAELLQQLTPLKRQEIWNEPVRVQPSTQAQAVVVAASATTGAEPKQSERASQEQEKLGDISANALKKLALISASRSSNLTPDANPTSTPSGMNDLAKFREEAMAALRNQLGK